MSAPGLGSGPIQSEACSSGCLPDGWTWADESRGLIQPDPKALGYPSRLGSFELKIWERLRSDPDLRQGWSSRRDELIPVFNDLFWLPRDAPDRSNRMH